MHRRVTANLALARRTHQGEPMNIAQRLALLLAVPLVALVAVGVFLHLQLLDIERHGRQVSEKQIPSVAAIGHITRAYGELRVDARDYVYGLEKTQRETAQAHFDAVELRLNGLFERYAARLITDQRDGRLLKEYRSLLGEWIDGVR